MKNSTNEDRKALGKKNKTKGSVAERYYRDQFKREKIISNKAKMAVRLLQCHAYRVLRSIR